jgi:hypothetical protein
VGKRVRGLYAEIRNHGDTWVIEQAPNSGHVELAAGLRGTYFRKLRCAAYRAMFGRSLFFYCSPEGICKRTDVEQAPPGLPVRRSSGRTADASTGQECWTEKHYLTLKRSRCHFLHRARSSADTAAIQPTGYPIDAAASAPGAVPDNWPTFKTEAFTA